MYQRSGPAVKSGGLALWDAEGGVWGSVPGLGAEGLTGIVLSLASLGPLLFVGARFDRFSASTARFTGVAVYNAASREWAPLGAGVAGGDTNALLHVCKSGNPPPRHAGCGAEGYDLYVGGG